VLQFYYTVRGLLGGLTFQTRNAPNFLVVFSGRRSCLGELLARQELFLFVTGLIHQFIIEPPIGCDTIECQEKMETISVAPTLYEVRFIRRQDT
jgi:hypothetical protein